MYFRRRNSLLIGGHIWFAFLWIPIFMVDTFFFFTMKLGHTIFNSFILGMTMSYFCKSSSYSYISPDAIFPWSLMSPSIPLTFPVASLLAQTQQENVVYINWLILLLIVLRSYVHAICDLHILFWQKDLLCLYTIV